MIRQVTQKYQTTLELFCVGKNAISMVMKTKLWNGGTWEETWGNNMFTMFVYWLSLPLLQFVKFLRDGHWMGLSYEMTLLSVCFELMVGGVSRIVMDCIVMRESIQAEADHQQH